MHAQYTLGKIINKLDQRGTMKVRKSPVNKRRRIMGGTVNHLIPQAAQQWMIIIKFLSPQVVSSCMSTWLGTLAEEATKSKGGHFTKLK